MGGYKFESNSMLMTDTFYFSAETLESVAYDLFKATGSPEETLSGEGFS